MAFSLVIARRGEHWQSQCTENLSPKVLNSYEKQDATGDLRLVYGNYVFVVRSLFRTSNLREADAARTRGIIRLENHPMPHPPHG